MAYIQDIKHKIKSISTHKKYNYAMHEMLIVIGVHC